MVIHTNIKNEKSMKEAQKKSNKDLTESVYEKSNKITNILDKDSLSGKRCFIIGGGDSLRDVDLSVLANEVTIGINISFIHFSSTLLYFMDLPFYSKVISGKYDQENIRKVNVKEKWNEFKGIKIFLSQFKNVDLQSNVFVVKRLHEKLVSTDVSEGIYPAANSGFGALMLAISLGCKEIYLLGFDACIGSHIHWHEGYFGQTVNNMHKKLEQNVPVFVQFAPLIKEKGIRVFNCNQKSAIRCFEYCSLEEALKK